MHRFITLAVVAVAGALTSAAETYTLEQCRQLALSNNKEVKVHEAEARAAEYQKRQARAAYLPSLDLTASYIYNQKDISVISEDAYLPVKTFDLASKSYKFDVVKNPYTGQPIMVDGKPIPSQVALLPKEALTFDIHNVFAGALTLTQPIFMGGKIAAMNQLADAAQRAAVALKDREVNNVIYDVDAAYWMVVSLCAKERLAKSYVAMLDTLDHNVNAMLKQGVATKSDLLSVDVKLNQANVDLTKVTNGVALARMALAQKCGLPINSNMSLADENGDISLTDAETVPPVNMNEVYMRRYDMQALNAAIDAGKAQSKVALSSMLPQVALVGAYTVSSPNVFNGFDKKLNGMFSVGVMATVPIWHWGGNYNKYKAAQTKVEIAELQRLDAQELIDLQVNQARFKMEESLKTLNTSKVNMVKANENLRSATLAYKEGVSTTELVMQAQTAWLKAASEEVDAKIDVRLCHVYLDKAMGTLSANQ